MINTRQTLPVPIFKKVYKSVDATELSDENLSLIDGYLDELGGTVARPGSAALWNFASGTGIGWDGLYYWQEKKIAVGVAQGGAYRMTYQDGEITSSTAFSVPLLQQGKRATFATDGVYLFIATGGPITYMTDSVNLTVLSGTNAPTSVSHVDFIDGYIVANSLNTNRWHWCDPNSSLSWNALNFASAAGSSDNIVAIKILNREIYIFGTRTIEIWENDGQTPFSRIPGGFIQSGCSAPHTIAIDEESIYWLDDRRHFVRYTGKGVESLATPYDRVIQSFPTVADAFVQKIEIDSRPFLVFQFPTANRTIVYNITQEDWCEWGKWEPERSEYDRWVGGAYCYAEPWGMHLIGRRDQMVVSRLSQSYTDDDGAYIRLARTTGHINYGTTKNKASNELRIIARRGEGLSTRTPKLMLRYREDGKNWSQPRELSLGDKGAYELVLRDTRRGIYRTRQYEFTATDSVPLVFISAEEDIEVLR
jgi:hypothetical protein